MGRENHCRALLWDQRSWGVGWIRLQLGRGHWKGCLLLRPCFPTSWGVGALPARSTIKSYLRAHQSVCFAPGQHMWSLGLRRLTCSPPPTTWGRVSQGNSAQGWPRLHGEQRQHRAGWASEPSAKLTKERDRPHLEKRCLGWCLASFYPATFLSLFRTDSLFLLLLVVPLWRGAHRCCKLWGGWLHLVGKNKTTLAPVKKRLPRMFFPKRR